MRLGRRPAGKLERNFLLHPRRCRIMKEQNNGRIISTSSHAGLATWASHLQRRQRGHCRLRVRLARAYAALWGDRQRHTPCFRHARLFKNAGNQRAGGGLGEMWGKEIAERRLKQMVN